MNILIVEDEKLAVRKLTKLLEEVAPDFAIKGVTPSIQETVEWLEANRAAGHSEPDIIFLDIELADGQSFEIFNRTPVRSTVIFTTSYDEFALRAFKVKSIDYLLKPVQKEDLQRSIEKYHDLTGNKPQEDRPAILANVEDLLKSLQKPKAEYRKRFLVKQGSKMLSLGTADIAFFYAEESICFFKSHQGQRFVVDYKMDELEESLDPEHFFRINRGLIITHQAVTQIESYFNNRLILNLKPAHDKEAIVSRERVADFKNWMGK